MYKDLFGVNSAPGVDVRVVREFWTRVHRAGADGPRSRPDQGRDVGDLRRFRVDAVEILPRRGLRFEGRTIFPFGS